MKPFEHIKEVNFKRVIQFIRQHGPVPRVEISERLNIPQPTVTRIIEELLKENILKEIGLGHSTGGRRPVLLTFNSRCSYSAGVELGRSSVKVALTDLNGGFLSFRMKETKGTEKITEIVEIVKHSLQEILYETQIDPELLLGVGVGLPGPLNETEGSFISPPNFYGLSNIPLKTMLGDALNFPVIIDNDANVAALAEKWFGKGMGVQHFVYVLADVGIGSGIIVNGDIYRGLNGEAGEIGHSTINLFGEKCTCGNYGCLETLASIPKIVEAARNRLKVSTDEEHAIFGKAAEEIRFTDIVNALHNGSKLARQTMEEAAQYMAVGISNLINFCAPELVIVGGRFGRAHSSVVEVINSTFRSRVLGWGVKKIPLVVSDFDEGVVLGAAALVINETFSLSSKE